MKAEDSPSTPSATPAPTQTTYTAAATWSTQIPIDPALQQQSQHPAPAFAHYYQHYPQATYAASHYQQYVPPTQSQSSTTPRPATTTPTQTSTQQVQSQSNTIDTSDIATLNDALGSAGVDLRAEEESLQRSYDSHHLSYRSYEDRTRKQPPNPAFDTIHILNKMRGPATAQQVPNIPTDSVNYLALSLRARLQDLLVAMIAASEHRTDTQFDRPASTYADGATQMWSIVVKNDVAKQLAVLERIEREEELRLRRERKERAELVAATLQQGQAEGAEGAGEAIEEDMQPKKKKKKEGPGVAARNMSEDVRKKMSNAVASQAAGIGGRYAWMNAAASGGPAAAKPKREASVAGANTSAAGGGGTWARPYLPTKTSSAGTTVTVAKTEEEDTRRVVTLRDALFAIEKERGHGGGKGSARGWV